MLTADSVEERIIAAIKDGRIDDAAQALSESSTRFRRRGSAIDVIVAMASSGLTELLTDFLRGGVTRAADAVDIFYSAISVGELSVASTIIASTTRNDTASNITLWSPKAFQMLGRAPLEALMATGRLAAPHYEPKAHASHLLDGLASVPQPQVTKHIKVLASAGLTIPISQLIRFAGSSATEAKAELRDYIEHRLVTEGPKALWAECHDYDPDTSRPQLAAAMFRVMLKKGLWGAADVAACLSSLSDLHLASALGLNTLEVLPFINDPALATTAMDLGIGEE